MTKNRLRNFWYRIYSDFLMPSRLHEYEALLAEAIKLGYNTYSIRSFFCEKPETPRAGEKYLIVRHDVDTDTATAKLMFAIEERLGVYSSYYFRLSTLDAEFMRAIEEHGSEASYHFEEIATVAKQKRLKSRDAVMRHIAEIQELFAHNVRTLRREFNVQVLTVASHGDFINRFLDMPNWELLSDSLRRQLDIAVETYDPAINRIVSSRHSDEQYPFFWKPRPPIDALRQGELIVYLLVHPRPWRANRPENLADDALRVWQGVRYWRPNDR